MMEARIVLTGLSPLKVYPFSLKTTGLYLAVMTIIHNTITEKGI